MCAGGIGFWTFAFPQDLIKSIIQTQSSLQHVAASSTAARPSASVSVASSSISSSSPSPLSFLATGRQLVTNEGLGRLWRGFPIALFRGIPGAAITFTTYTTVMRNLNERGW